MRPAVAESTPPKHYLAVANQKLPRVRLVLHPATQWRGVHATRDYPCSLLRLCRRIFTKHAERDELIAELDE
jgi:hypothetical protein